MNEILSLALPVVSYESIKCIHGFMQIKADYPDYVSDESKLTSGSFETIFFPKNEPELAAVLKRMNQQSTPVTIAGARTGLVGGSVPMSGALVSLEHFNQILGVHFDVEMREWRVELQAGVNLKQLDLFLKSRKNLDLPIEIGSKTQAEFQQFQQSPADFFYPPDPTEMSASIGGTVATNASGASTFRYGPTRSWIRGLRVVLANGECLDIPRGKFFASPDGLFEVKFCDGSSATLKIPHYTPPSTKNAAGLFTEPGMDLIDLFIGSEGVLGVITRVEVAVLERTQKLSMIQFLESEQQAIDLTIALREEKDIQLDYLEFFSTSTLSLLRSPSTTTGNSLETRGIPLSAQAALSFEFDFDPENDDEIITRLESLINSVGSDMAKSWAGFEARDLERFKAFRHQVPEMINRIVAEKKMVFPDIHKLGSDMAVPDKYLQDIWTFYKSACEGSGLEWYAFGHIGNNHIHVNIIPRNHDELEKGKALFEEFARMAVAMGGTVSAEHGIGKIKGRYFQMMYTPQDIEEMRSVKTVLDPNNILNRGDMLPIRN